MSKLIWDEQHQGKHAEMLDSVNSLIKLRRSRVCFNDGDLHSVHVYSDEKRKTLVMERDEAHILVNFGDQPCTFSLLDGETLQLVSRKDLVVEGTKVELPPMTLVVLLATTEDMEDRYVEQRRH